MSTEQLISEITRRVLATVAQGGPQARGPCSAEEPGKTVSGATCSTCGGCATKRPDDVRQLREAGLDRIAQLAGNDAPPADIAPFIDHTLLKPEATKDDLAKACAEAKKYGFATVCVNASNIRFVAAELHGSSVKPIAVVGFPLGAGTPHAKAFETKEAIRNGAREIDMVMNIGAMKSKDYATVLNDICAVVGAAGDFPVKVILETGGLSYDEKVIGCTLSKVAGAAYVKTSTGFGPGGATAEDIALMRRIVGPDMGVKASGGVRTTEDAKKMLGAGATRIGASASVGIVTGSKPASAGKY
ncbi:MAG: deoxyribose-phosphate aldolase [Deltaproteobacteria bacterium]|nr:deoxyribose-phosphate aldolase [Deltaproteobacteria bacterium]